jgi:hypothetical protein
MRLARHVRTAVGTLLLLAIPVLLFVTVRPAPVGHERRDLRPRATPARPFQPNGLRQRQLLGINPDDLILYAPATSFR